MQMLQDAHNEQKSNFSSFL